MPSYTNRPGSTKPWGPRRKGLLSAVLSYDSRDNDASAGWLGLPASMWKSLALALGFLLFIWIVGGINWAPPEHAQSLARAQFERKRRRDPILADGFLPNSQHCLGWAPSADDSPRPPQHSPTTGADLPQQKGTSAELNRAVMNPLNTRL